MADAAPAPPPAAKPATPSPTPSGKQPAAFDVRMALAKSLGTPRSGDLPEEPPAATKGENVDEAPADTADTAEPDTSEGAEGEDSATDAETTEEAGEASTPEAQLEAAAKAFAAGDLEALSKALAKEGIKVSGPVQRAFRVHKRRLEQAEARDRKAIEREKNFEASRSRAQQEIADESRRLSEQQRGLIQKYGWAAALERAWDDEDMVGVAKALEKACKGATLATITQRLASGKQGKSPEEQRLAEERRKFEEQKAAEERKKAQGDDQKVQAQKREAAVARVGEALKAHPYLVMTNDKGEKVTDTEALGEVFAAYEKSWNGEKFTKTAKACADELQEKLLARAKARGLSAAPAPAKPTNGKNGKPVPKKPAQRAGLKEPPRTTNPARGTPADLEASRAMRIANARRITEMQRRGVR